MRITLAYKGGEKEPKMGFRIALKRQTFPQTTGLTQDRKINCAFLRTVKEVSSKYVSFKHSR